MATDNVIELHNASIYHLRDAGMKLKKGKNRYKGCELVLGGVDFSVAKGEFVYLIGRVGSGKSTLLRTLYAEVPLAEGEGMVVGFNLKKLRKKDVPFLRRRMGIVFQDYQLLHDRSVFKNLHYMMKATGWKNETDIRRRVDEVLQMVNLSHKLYKMPHQLSGGEQQRLAVARALLNKPDVLLADEPTGNLDPAAAAEVMGLFHQIRERGCAVVMSTHNINIIEEYPARAVRFMQGRIDEIDIASMLKQ